MAKTKLFHARQFTPTQWDSADQKAKFANQFVRFVESDFAPHAFPKWFYKRLSMTFGHIAHYDQGGFYATFFTTPQDKVRFVEHCLTCGGYGDPAWTYSDVELVLKAWLKDRDVLKAAEAADRAFVEQHERALLAKLKEKYE